MEYTDKDTTPDIQLPVDGNGPITSGPTNTTQTTDSSESLDTSDTKDTLDTSNTPQTYMIDQDVLNLRAKPLDEQLWFFIDDVVPKQGEDTEVVLINEGMTGNGIPAFGFAPKSMEIFEEIANIPNHVATSYPSLVKYFADIIRLYNDYVKQDINPFWSIQPLQPNAPAFMNILLGMERFGHQGFLSLDPKPQSVPVRLIYGDISHKHDFVGIVYLYVN